MVKPNPMLCAPINNNWGGSAGILIFFVLPVYVVLCILLYDFFIRDLSVSAMRQKGLMHSQIVLAL